MVKPIVTSTLGTIPKGLVQGLKNLESRGGESDIVHTAALVRSEKILNQKIQSKPAVKVGMNNSLES